MILLIQYFGAKSHPLAHDANANILLAQVNLCLHKAESDGCYDGWVDPDTNCRISGAKGGGGDGGYRTPDSKTGGPKSSHREAKGVDVYDPEQKLAEWCMKNKAILRELGLWMEHPAWTVGWCHFQTRPASYTVYIPYSDIKKHPPALPLKPWMPDLPFVVR